MITTTHSHKHWTDEGGHVSFTTTGPPSPCAQLARHSLESLGFISTAVTHHKKSGVQKTSRSNPDGPTGCVRRTLGADSRWSTFPMDRATLFENRITGINRQASRHS